MADPPQTLPIELSASIAQVLYPGSSPPREPPSIEEQLANLFPDAKSLHIDAIQHAQQTLRAQIDDERIASQNVVKDLEEEQKVARMSNVQESIGVSPASVWIWSRRKQSC